MEEKMKVFGTGFNSFLHIENALLLLFEGTVTEIINTHFTIVFCFDRNKKSSATRPPMC